MSGEWQCPGCNLETEAYCDHEHVYECLVRNNYALRLACEHIANANGLSTTDRDGKSTWANPQYWLDLAKDETETN